MAHKKEFLTGQRIWPEAIRGDERIDRLIDETFLAYNGGRLQKACRLFTEKMLQDEILGRAAAEHQQAALAVAVLRRVDDGGGLVDVAADVDARPAAAHGQLGDVHADR